MIGRRIGQRYEIIRYIGGGGMSRVYLAHDVILDRDVAIKILHYDFTNEEELKHRFLREALSATSLTHPHIVDIFDVGEDGDIHYLVMEYIEGQTLKEYIVENGPLGPQEAVSIMLQLVSAISNAHYNGIVHRDIKPQNILMDHDGNVKITDFGIAMALSATAHTKTNSVLGTVHYLSPEQARGGMATKKSDIYSLGIVLYELLAAKLPFSGESAVAIALKHLQEQTPSIRAINPAVPQSLENVILKATAKEPMARYYSSEEMEDDLATVLSPERAHEPAFQVPYDDEATRVMPVIKEPKKVVAQVPKEETLEEKESEATKKNKQKKRNKKAVWLFFGLGSLILISIIVLLLVGLLSSKQQTIPEVAGLTEEEAVEQLEELGFKVTERLEQPSEEYEAGLAISTSPEAGRKRDVGTELTLYISLGEEQVELVDLVGESIETATEKLKTLGFQSIELKEIHSDEASGTILQQQPAAGTKVTPEKTDVTLTVSKGKDIGTVDNLKGMTRSELDNYASNTGFSIAIVREDYSEQLPEGQVISQKPSAGSKLEKGKRIEVIVSKGPEKKPLKHVTKTIEIAYTGTVTEEDENGEEQTTTPPQTVRIYVQDRNHTMATVFEEFTITKDTTSRIKMELEQGGQGGYKVTRDGTMIKEETVSYNSIQ